MSLFIDKIRNMKINTNAKGQEMLSQAAKKLVIPGLITKENTDRNIVRDMDIEHIKATAQDVWNYNLPINKADDPNYMHNAMIWGDGSTAPLPGSYTTTVDPFIGYASWGNTGTVQQPLTTIGIDKKQMKDYMMSQSLQFSKPSKNSFEEILNEVFTTSDKEQFLLDMGYLIEEDRDSVHSSNKIKITRKLADGTVKVITNTLNDLFLKEVTVKFKNLLMAKATLKLKL